MRPRSFDVLLVSLSLGVFGCGASPPPAPAPAPAASAPPVSRVPAWLEPWRALCPADVVAPETAEIGAWQNVCEGRALDDCMRRCEANDPTACYAAAIHVQTVKAVDLSEALFTRACKLGVASGCTNRAAGMLVAKDTERLACTTRTFRMTCSRRDAWGCTMYGAALVEGRGVKQNLDEARQVLPLGCRDGEDDPACQAAQALLRKIGPR